MINKNYLFLVVLILLLNACKEKQDKASDSQSPSIHKTNSSQKPLSISYNKADSLQLQKTKRLFDTFMNQIDLNTGLNLSGNLLDSVLKTYSHVKYKKADDAYSIYKNGWHFYMDRNDHANAIKLIEDFILISKNDPEHNKIQLLEAYSYLGSEFSFSGQCDKAIEYSYEPFLKLYKTQLALTEKQREDVEFLKTGELMTYTGYLECSSLLNDGNLQNKILTITEKLIEEQHDDIPWYNVYKSDLLGMMSTIYMSMGDLGKAKIFLDLYDAYMEPQDVIDDLLLSDRKMTYYAEIKDEAQFEHEFKNSKTNFTKALNQFATTSEEYFLAVHNHRLAFERYATMLAKKNTTHTKIPALYHKSLNMIDGMAYDNYINPLNAYRGLISYFNAIKDKDSAVYYLKHYKDLALDLNVVDAVRDSRVYYLEKHLNEKEYDLVDTLIVDYFKALHITDIKTFLIDNKASNTVLANEKTINRLVKMASLLEKHAKDNPSFGNKQSNEFYLLAASLLNTLKQNQWFNPKEIKQLKQINTGILSTRTALTQTDDLIIKYLESNMSLELLQKNANNNINLNENTTLDSLVKKRARISRQILNLTNRNLNTANDSTQNNQQKYIELLNERAQINSEIKKENPKYKLYTNPDFNLKIYRKDLDYNTVVIRFYITETNCYAYTISKDKLEYFNLGKRQEFTSLVAEFREKIKRQDYLKTTIISLKILLEPLETIISEYDNYKIIPNEELSYLPFEVVFGDISKSEKVISYNTSLILDGFKQQTTSNMLFAAYAPNYEYNNTLANSIIVENLERSGNYALPNALEESAYISSLFEGELFKEKNATKAHFKANATKFSMLHLAMHAVVNNNNKAPQATLLFSGNNEEDYLNLNDIYNLDLNIDLTTLSACNTAYGKIDPVEGVMSLSRAFQYAGSKATVTSLWKVPDKATSIIMKQFYNNLKDGDSKSEALKNAKLDYIKTTEDVNLKHPYYWAGFVLTGDVSPIVLTTNYWAYALIILGLLAIYLLIRSRRLKSKL